LINIILRGIKAYEIVLDGVISAEDADNTEVDAFKLLKHTASTISIQLGSQDILGAIVKLEDPRLTWTWLCTEYY